MIFQPQDKIYAARVELKAALVSDPTMERMVQNIISVGFLVWPNTPSKRTHYFVSYCIM